METDQNQNPSASCFPQLEPTRKEGRRSMKSAGRKDTTRREESAENCRVQFAVSERMRDMHRKVHMWKEVGELSSTKREPSVVLRSNSARDGKVTQQSLTKTRQPHAYFRFFANIAPVQLNILKIHATTSPLEHPRYDEHGILPLVNTASQKTLRYRYTIQNRPHVAFQYFMYYTRGTRILNTHQRPSCRTLPSCSRIIKTSWRKRQVQLNNEQYPLHPG